MGPDAGRTVILLFSLQIPRKGQGPLPYPITFIGLIVTLTFGGTGAPSGMFVITGNGLNVKPFLLIANDPVESGPMMMYVLPAKLIWDDVCVHIEPMKVSFWPTKLKAADEFFSTVASVSMSLFPDEPCQLSKLQLVFWAQIVWLFPVIVI